MTSQWQHKEPYCERTWIWAIIGLKSTGRRSNITLVLHVQRLNHGCLTMSKLSTKPLSEPMLEYCLMGTKEQPSVTSQSKFIYFIHENAFENVVRILTAILSRTQCVKHVVPETASCVSNYDPWCVVDSGHGLYYLPLVAHICIGGMDQHWFR